MSSENKEDVAEDCSNPDVVTKYMLAGEIANNALKHVMSLCKPGARIVEICDAGDAFIMEATGKVFKGKKVEKGLGFPTCVSVNHIVGHFSPLAKDESVLAKDDVAKIDLGVYLDGYVAVAAHTCVIGEDGPTTSEITGKVADVVNAAAVAAELAIRMLKPGNKNNSITEMFQKVSDTYKVSIVQGVLSHEMGRFMIDGEKCIISKTDPEQKVDEFEFEPNQVFAIDIVMSSGEGKTKAVDERTCVYKRATDATYQLKMKASRQVFSEICQKFPTYPFTMRAMDESKVRFGIKECVAHSLVHGYPVLQEKEGEVVAHFKFTCLVMANGTKKVAGLPLDVSNYKSEFSIQDEELLKVLATSAGKKKKKNNKKKKKAAAE
jgi:curved DNA binding protein